MILSLCTINYSYALSAVEKKISLFIEQQQESQLSLLEKLVNINSGTDNIPGVHHVGDLLRTEFNQIGFQTRWVAEPVNMHRAATLIAQRQGDTGKRILLIGHLDTVFPKESSFQKFVRKGSTATGPGVIDDKGGDMVILYALKALQSVHMLDNTSITVVLTGDEEESGKPAAISRKPLFDVAKQSDIALDFECAITAETATIARRGITNWLLTTQGNEAHSSEIYRQSVGYGAIFELSRILDSLRTELSGEKYLTINPGITIGGTTIQYDHNKATGSAFGQANVIAKTSLTKGDLRYISTQQKIHAKKQILAIVQNHLTGTHASITFEDGIPPMSPQPGNIALLKAYSHVSHDLGYGTIKPLDPGIRGAGDISYIASIVSGNLAGLGPLGNDAHSMQETLDIASLTMQTQRAAILIYRLTHNSL